MARTLLSAAKVRQYHERLGFGQKQAAKLAGWQRGNSWYKLEARDNDVRISTLRASLAHRQNNWGTCCAFEQKGQRIAIALLSILTLAWVFGSRRSLPRSGHRAPMTVTDVSPAIPADLRCLVGFSSTCVTVPGSRWGTSTTWFVSHSMAASCRFLLRWARPPGSSARFNEKANQLVS